MFEVDTRRLRMEMAAAGVNNITELSELTGVNRNTIADVIKGTAYPSSMVMAKIVKALGIGAETAGEIFFKEKLTDSVS